MRSRAKCLVLSLLAAAAVEQTTELLREGVRARVLWPQVTLQRVPGQLDRQLNARTEEGGFYKPFRNFPRALPDAERERLARAGREAVEQSVMPALRKFRDYFVKEYLPA